MLPVSNEFSKAIVADVRDMPYRVRLAGLEPPMDQTQIPNMTLNESMSGNNGIGLGTANAAELTLTLREPALTNYNGLLVEPESGIVLPDGSIEWVPLGKFWVTNTSTSNDYKTVKLTCADSMYKLSDEYISGLKYPTSIQNVVTEIVDQISKRIEGFAFIPPESWPDLEVRVKPEKLTLRNAVGYAAGCCGCNARFNRDGALEFVWYKDTGETIERTAQYMDGMTKLNDKPLGINFKVTGDVEKYTVSIETAEGGDATASPSKNVLEGDLVTISVRPSTKSGFKYELGSISAADAHGNPVDLSADAEGAGYTFKQPDSDVTVSIAFRRIDISEVHLLLGTFGPGYLEIEGGYPHGYYREGDKVTLIATPNEGFILEKIVVTPSDFPITLIGTTAEGSTKYSLTMPSYDIDVRAHFKRDNFYNIERKIAPNKTYLEPGSVKIKNEDREDGYMAGDIIIVEVEPKAGHVFDRCESNVTMTQIDDNRLQFVMPYKDVSITVHFKYSEDESKTGLYSWLQSPAAPPSPKPFWAVLYNEDFKSPINKKYWLVWFDSWSIFDANSVHCEDGGYLHTIQFVGYYCCGSKDTGNGAHEWDTTTWSGNGAFASQLNWDVRIDGLFCRSYRTPYCLLASNVPLLNNGLAFEACPNAIQSPQTSFIVDGMDVRERGSLSSYNCPETFSTPMPASNWLVVKSGSHLFNRLVGDRYEGAIDGNQDEFIVFYDGISVTNIGKAFEDSEESFYIATLTNGSYVRLKEEEDANWGELKTVPDDCYLGLRNPLNGSASVYGWLLGASFSGILASSDDIYADGSLLAYKNNCRICDCGDAPTTFALRSSGFDVDPVKVTYTNPMIYVKMVDAIQAAVQNISYTPAKVKCRGNPAFQAGDIVTVPDGNDPPVYHKVIILQQTMTFGGGMNTNISCPGQTADAVSFSANGPITTQIKNEVSQSYAELEHAIAANNAAIFSAIYGTFGDKTKSLQTQADNLNNSVAKHDTKLSNAEERLQDLEENLSYSEKDLQEMEGIVKTLEGNMSVAQADIDSLEGRVGVLENKELPQAAETVLGGVKAKARNAADTQEVHIDPDTGFLYTAPGSGGGNGDGEGYTLPQATAEVLGGVKAKPREATDTQEVRVDPETGFLYTAPGGGGNGDEEGYTLPQAAADTLGGVKAVAKTTETTPVAIDENGQLFVPESSGGGGVKRALLAQWGDPTCSAVGTDITAQTLIPWVATETFYDAMRKYKQFQIDILSSISGNGLTSVVVGNPVVGFNNSAFDAHITFYCMVKPSVIANIKRAIDTSTYLSTFAIIPYNNTGAISTMSKVVCVNIYGIE